jgi:UDP-N-acetylglucosamine/UDP-N-acetylgalactosamine diphosphorylase
LQVNREEEFAPVKNASGMPFDSPDTARTLMLRLHMNWVAEAGGFVVNKSTVPAAGKETLGTIRDYVFYLDS